MRVTVNTIQVANEIKVANTFYSRLIGLMFTKKMNGYDALLLEPANSIHTCFMRYSIDVLFIDKKNRIIKIVRKMKPWRMTGLYWRSVKVIELPGGFLSNEIRKGDELCIN